MQSVFASNYRIEPGKNVQLAAKYPLIGANKIALVSINEDGNSPAKTAWGNMRDRNNKSLDNSPFQ
jgi:hypothetical protein